MSRRNLFYINFLLIQLPQLCRTNRSFMKNVKTINKISVRAGTAEARLLKHLASGSLRGRKMMVEPGLTAYHLPDGSILEIYGPGSSYPLYLFKYGNIVVSFNVDSLKDALVPLINDGGQLLSNIEKVCDHFVYCHVLLEKNTVIGLYQDIGPDAIDTLALERLGKH